MKYTTTLGKINTQTALNTLLQKIDLVLTDSWFHGQPTKTYNSASDEVEFILTPVEDVLTKAYMTLLLTHGQAEGAIVYSDIVQAGALDNPMPDTFPNSTLYDEDGEIDRQMQIQEYGQVFEVVGGYIVRFTNGMAGLNYRPVDDATLRLWISLNSNNFQTKKAGKALIAEFAATQEP